jgi:spermidine synthase
MMPKKRPRANGDFRLALGVLALSGSAALGHEVLWTRRMIDLLGASVLSSARVFECFFLGLALGAMSIALLLPGVRRHWRWLGGVELGVAVLCVPVLALPSWTNWMWPTIGPERLVSWEGAAIKTALSAFVLLPPTFLMGMTLPLGAAAALRGKPSAVDREIWLYAGNTLGGVLGLGTVVLVLLWRLGLAGSMVAMIGLNLTASAICFWRDSIEPKQASAVSHLTRSATGGSRVGSGGCPGWLPLGLAFFSGAGILSLEVLGLAMANLAAPVAIYPQAGILTCVILLLSASAWLVPKLGGAHERRDRRFQAAPPPTLPSVLLGLRRFGHGPTAAGLHQSA